MRRLALLAVLLALAACATPPPPPLLSPLVDTGAYGYGYVERRLGGPEDWEVTFVGPVRRTAIYAGSREADQAAARTQAFDLMLWRAAQIALREGYPAFRVGQTRSNVDTRVEDYGYDPLYGPGWGPWGPWMGPRRFAYPYYSPYPYARSAAAYLQAQITGDIHLLHAAAPGDYVADDVIAQARRTYPNAEAVPAQ